MNGPGQSLEHREDVFDLDLIAERIEPGSRLLDVGCGDGELLARLVRTRNVDGRGIELSQEGVNASVARGLAVIQGDADRDLEDYPDNAFDYAILSQTIQQTRNPKKVLADLRRISQRAVVSLPNFGHWRIRLHLLVHGRMPVSRKLGYAWYDTPNIHLCTLQDFVSLAQELDFRIDEVLLISGGKTVEQGRLSALSNLTAQDAIFFMSRA